MLATFKGQSCAQSIFNHLILLVLFMYLFIVFPVRSALTHAYSQEERASERASERERERESVCVCVCVCVYVSVRVRVCVCVCVCV